MSNPSRRPQREQIKELRREKKKQQKVLREQQQAPDLAPFVKSSVPNACSPFDTVEDECAGRFKAVVGQAHVFRQQFHAIEQAQIELVKQLIRKKKFMPFRVNNCYPIVIDGTQKLAGLELWSEELLQRRIPSSSDKQASDKPSSDEESVRYKYSIYVLEANLSFRNGMVIPLMTAFLNYQEGDSERKKQDCETRAFHRLAERIKKAFPRLPVMLLFDGLYAQGPVMERCQDYNWQFMIVLKKKAMQKQEQFLRLIFAPQSSQQDSSKADASA